MSKFTFDKQPFEITCPNCGQKIKKTFGWLKNTKNRCPGCSATFDSKEFTAVIKKIEKQVSDLNRSIKDFNRQQ